MTVAILVALILGWTDAVDAPAAEEIAEAVLGAAGRESLDPVMVLAVIAQESAFDADPCSRRVALDRVLSRAPVDGHPDREVLRWTCGSSTRTERTCERTVWEVEERDGYLYIDTCPAGEVGLMQVLRSSRWASSGYEIPGTGGEVLSRSVSERRAQFLRPEVNVALGCRELAEHREAAGRTAEDPWWKWVGSYNTGTHRGEGAKRYARTILGRYGELCDLPVPGEAGDLQLGVIWPGCADAAAALEDLH